jgi:hypothetical protein
MENFRGAKSTVPVSGLCNVILKRKIFQLIEKNIKTSFFYLHEELVSKSDLNV